MRHFRTCLEAGVALAAVSFGTAAAAAVLESTVSFADGTELIENPGCGEAKSPGFWTTLTPDMSSEGVDICSTTRNSTKLWCFPAFSKGNVYNGDEEYYRTNIVGYVGGEDIPLSENVLLAVSNSLLRCRLNGGTCIPRFAYTKDGLSGAEPSDFEMLLTHIRQLAGVVSQFGDVVPAVECGMVGPWGEMHSSAYSAAEYMNRVVGTWLGALPADIALLVRSPTVWMEYLGTTTSEFFAGGMESLDPALRVRMGFFNDGYLGTDADYGTWDNGRQKWSRAQGRAFLKGQDVPYGGEMSPVKESFFDANVTLLDSTKYNIVEEWYDTHISYLRSIRSTNMVIAARLSEKTFSCEKWAWDGMPGLSEYEGKDLRKFFEDHMGCRFVVRGVSLESAPGHGRLGVTVENTGFGRLLFDDALELLLVKGASAIAAPLRDGSADTLRSIGGGAASVLELDFDCPDDLVDGSYDVYLRARVPLADEDGTGLPRRFVRFANAGCYDSSLKANYLCTVALDGEFDFVGGSPWFAWFEKTRSAYGGSWGDSYLDREWNCRDFRLDSSVPRGRQGDVKIEMVVEGLNEIPQPEGGKASFVFLYDDGGRPVPYGYCAEGWKRLYGCEPEEGSSVVVHLRLAGGRVGYAIGDTVLVDDADRKWLPSTGSAQDVSKVVFAGAENVGDFNGTLRDDLAGKFRITIW